MVEDKEIKAPKSPFAMRENEINIINRNHQIIISKYDEMNESLREELVEQIENIDFDYRINGKDGNKVMIKVDTSKQAMADVISKFMKYGNVIDMEAMPVPLEEVIYDIYTRNQE